MGVQVSPIFQAVEESARKTPWDRDRLLEAAALCLAAKHKNDEIQAVRQNREAMRRACLRDGSRNATTPTLDLHPLELEAVRFLCPESQIAHWGAKKETWAWVLKQPWAQEFKAPPFEKVRH